MAAACPKGTAAACGCVNGKAVAAPVVTLVGGATAWPAIDGREDETTCGGADHGVAEEGRDDGPEAGVAIMDEGGGGAT